MNIGQTKTAFSFAAGWTFPSDERRERMFVLRVNRNTTGEYRRIRT